MPTNSHELISGSPTLLRDIWGEKVCFALPAVIVEESPDLVALYWRAGTRGKGVSHRIRPVEFLTPETLHPQDWQWTRTDVLALIRPGEAHSVYLMRAGGWGEQVCWYINLQDPLRRRPLSFDTRDHLLDLVIHPDFSRWRWKDEDEFADARQVGLFTPQQAAAIRAEGENALGLLLGERRAFFEKWQNWSPPAAWTIPSLPAEWQSLG